MQPASNHGGASWGKPHVPIFLDDVQKARTAGLPANHMLPRPALHAKAVLPVDRYGASRPWLGACQPAKHSYQTFADGLRGSSNRIGSVVVLACQFGYNDRNCVRRSCRKVGRLFALPPAMLLAACWTGDRAIDQQPGLPAGEALFPCAADGHVGLPGLDILNR